MKKILITLFSICFITSIDAGGTFPLPQNVNWKLIYQAIRHDNTLIGDGCDIAPLGVNPDVAVGLAHGFDDVLTIGQWLTTDKSIGLGGHILNINTDAIAQLSVDDGNEIISLGDLSNGLNSDKFTVDPVNSRVYYDNATHTGMVGINQSTPSAAFDVYDAMWLDAIGGVYKIGDLERLFNGMETIVDASANTFAIESGSPHSKRYIFLDPGSDEYSFGDIDGLGNGTKLFINNGSQYLTLSSTFGGAHLGINTVPVYDLDVSGIAHVSSSFLADGAVQFSTYGAGTATFDGSGNISSVDLSSIYQAKDADLTTISGLTATTDNFMVAASSAWASRTPAQAKTSLSLNNVENTALSTWAGSTNFTTAGTISTGKWHGDLVDPQYGGTGVNNSTRTLTINSNSGTIDFTGSGKTLTVPLNASVSGTNTGDQVSVSGNAGTASALATGRTISGTGDATFTTTAFDGSAAVSGAVTVAKINGVALSGLATGILKNTTSTGVPSIAVAGDFPTLNQSTTGSAATLTTARTINGMSFDGSANITNILASGSPASSKTNSTGSDQDFTTLYTIPANTLIAGKMYKVNCIVSYTTGTSSVTLNQYLKVGTTKMYLGNAAVDLTNGRTDISKYESFIIMGTAAASGSAPVLVTNSSSSVTGAFNAVAIPTSIATNGTLDIIYGITYSGTGSTETTVLEGFWIEALN